MEVYHVGSSRPRWIWNLKWSEDFHSSLLFYRIVHTWTKCGSSNRGIVIITDIQLGKSPAEIIYIKPAGIGLNRKLAQRQLLLLLSSSYMPVNSLDKFTGSYLVFMMSKWCIILSSTNPAYGFIHTSHQVTADPAVLKTTAI